MKHNKLLNDLGVNYLVYSHMAAKTVRKCLKKQFLADAIVRDQGHIDIYKFENKKKIARIIPLKIFSDGQEFHGDDEFHTEQSTNNTVVKK